jgi:hypothetical protein
MTREEQRLLAEAEALSSPSFFADPINYIGVGSGVGVGAAIGLRFRIGIDPPNHYFKTFGQRLPHVQMDVWNANVKRSNQNVFRLPFPKSWYDWWKGLWE